MEYKKSFKKWARYDIFSSLYIMEEFEFIENEPIPLCEFKGLGMIFNSLAFTELEISDIEQNITHNLKANFFICNMFILFHLN